MNRHVTLEFTYELIQKIILLTLVPWQTFNIYVLSLLSREIFIRMPITYEQTWKQVSMTKLGNFLWSKYEILLK